MKQPTIDPRFAHVRLEVRRSRIHRWGVYAAEFIPRRRKVIEYTGELCNRIETKRRSLGRHVYVFTVNPYWTIDGSVGGSGAEFVNHSCEPNCVARVTATERVIYYAAQDIRRGEELTIDYQFARDAERHLCQCGAPGCRGTINLLE